MIFQKINPLLHFLLMRTHIGEDTTERTQQKRCLMKKYFLFAVLICGFSISACGGGGSGNSPAPTSIVPPLTLPGPYTVACSNVAQDFSRVAPGEDETKYWEGFPSASGAPRYMTDLLTDPVNALSVTVTAPNESNLYGSFAGKPIRFVVITCYPTVANNSRADYPLPTGRVVPHMQTGAEVPLFADATARYPVLVFSHGYGGSPISNDYIGALSWFASYGFVVVGPFHGDPRFSNLKIDDLADAETVLSHLGDFVALQVLRPLSMSAALDLVLTHPQGRDHVDAGQIGGFGASMGGETLMLMGGAGLTTSLGFDSTQVTLDPRLKAAVGYIPFFGEPFLPAFGLNQHGLDGVTMPYLAISGTADTTAPLVVTEHGIRRLKGTRELVKLIGVKHGLDEESINDIFTWSLTFLDAEVRGNSTARQLLSTMASVAGGGDDRVVILYNGQVLH
jgi:predicted dienelactone hydrolase